MSIEGAVNPNLQVQNQLNFEEAVNQSGNDKQYIYVKGGQVNREGAFSHLFTRKSVNVATTQALQNEILQNYGKDASDALSSRFDQFIRSKKQLTVGMAKELFAEAKALQENSAQLRELQESLKDLDPSIKNVLSLKIDSLIANGAPHDQVAQMIHAEADILQRDLDAIHAQADQVIQENKNWSPETQQLFKDTLESFITEKPWNLDKDSKDVARFMQEIPQVINNQMGKGDVLSKVKDPADQRDLLQMIASITLTNPDSPRQAALLQALPKIRAEQPNGLIRSDTIYKAVIGKEAPGNFENLSSIHADDVFNEGFNQMCEERSGLDSLTFQGVWGDFCILTAMGIPFDLALERSVELVQDPNSVHPIDIAKLNLSTEVSFKSGDYSIDRGEKQFGGTSGDFKRMPKKNTGWKRSAYG